MSTEQGTTGLAHTIHVGYGESNSDDVYENIEEFENVVDAMNLPNGSVKFSHEDGTEMLSGARIIRSRVKNLDKAVRYRCTSCLTPESDLIGRDRGEMEIECPVCEKEQQFKKMDVSEI